MTLSMTHLENKSMQEFDCFVRVLFSGEMEVGNFKILRIFIRQYFFFCSSATCHDMAIGNRTFYDLLSLHSIYSVSFHAYGEILA